MLHPRLRVSVVGLAVEDPQNSEEEVDDVQIQRDGGSNFLLHVIMSHDQLRVHENVPAEDERRNPPIYQLSRAVVREESRHEPEKNQSPQSSKQIWHPRSKVVLSLTRKQSQCNENTRGEDEGLEHNFGFIERYYDGNGVCF